MLGHPPKASARAERGQEIESQKREGTSSKPRTVFAPRAGLEPATLRLTGGKRNVSHSLLRFAACRRTRSKLSYTPTTGDLRLVPTSCCRFLLLAAFKGQEKGKVTPRPLACGRLRRPRKVRHSAIVRVHGRESPRRGNVPTETLFVSAHCPDEGVEDPCDPDNHLLRITFRSHTG